MKSLIKNFFITFSLFALMCTTAMADDKPDYSKLITAIATVESGNNDKAVNGIYAGFIQISPVCVAECNRINKMKGKPERYTLNDRFNRQKSIEMFYIIQGFYNPTHDIHYAILLWNEGCSAMKKQKRSTTYYNKVMKHYQD